MTTTILRANGVSMAQYLRVTENRRVYRRLLALGWILKVRREQAAQTLR